MSFLRRILRRMDTVRRRQVEFEYAHRNCGECHLHRINHVSNYIKYTILIFFAVIMPMVIVGYITGILILFISYAPYVVVVMFVLAYYSMPPHMRDYFKLLQRKKKGS